MNHHATSARRIAAVLAMGFLASTSAHATLNFVGACGDASAQACVSTDGSFEYLSMGGAKVLGSALPGLLAQGWTLGSRDDFVAMVARNAPVFTAPWNDLILDNGTILFGASGSTLQQNLPNVELARTGDTTIAASFKDIILKLGGINANPAYSLQMGTSELADNGLDRRFASLQAYHTDAGTSITRNNVFSGPAGTLTRSVSTESLAATNYFLLRPVTPVPEPKAYAMLVAGLGLLGFALRKRRHAARS